MDPAWSKRWRWGVVLVMALSYGAFVGSEWAISSWQRGGSLAGAAAVQADELVVQSLFRVPRDQLNRSYVQQAINGGQPFPQADGSSRVAWTNPQNGVKWELLFDPDGLLQNVRLASPPAPAIVQMAYVLQDVWPIVLASTAVMWMLCLGFYVIEEGIRPAMAWLLLALCGYFLALLLMVVAKEMDQRISTNVICPLIMIVIMVSLSVILFFGTKSQQKRRLDVCRGCGYNLRGNVSGRCPECGLEVPLRIEEAGHAAVAEALKRMTGD